MPSKLHQLYTKVLAEGPAAVLLTRTDMCIIERDMEAAATGPSGADLRREIGERKVAGTPLVEAPVQRSCMVMTDLEVREIWS
jgi:hypothetical protein